MLTLAVSTTEYLHFFRFGFTLISIVWTAKTISLQIYLMWIERMSEGLSSIGCKITAHAVENHSNHSNPDRNQFRYSGVDTATVDHCGSIDLYNANGS